MDKIIFVLGNLELGGAERQALILARHLAQREKVEVWGFNKSGPVADICEEHGIRWRVEPVNPQRLQSIQRVAGLAGTRSRCAAAVYVAAQCCVWICVEVGGGAALRVESERRRFVSAADDVGALGCATDAAVYLKFACGCAVFDREAES